MLTNASHQAVNPDISRSLKTRSIDWPLQSFLPNPITDLSNRLGDCAKRVVVASDRDGIANPIFKRSQFKQLFKRVELCCNDKSLKPINIKK